MNETTQYILLKTTRENIIARGFLLRVDFVGLEQIENNTWSYNIPDDQKPVARTYIQIDIISKIMMYIEDLVVLAESFLKGKQFYSELLGPSSGDLGEAIKFFFKNVDKLTDDDILKIMSWIDMLSIISNNNLNESIKKIQSYNITKVRNLLKELKDFGESNHPIYKRFKHGGMPVISPSVQLAPHTGPLSLFETYSIVSVGKDPMRDIHIIPFSVAMLERYKTLIHKIQDVLLEMTENRIACIQRQISRIFPKSYIKEEVSSQDAKRIDEQIEEYYKNHTPLFVPNQVHFDIGPFDIEKKIKWYLQTY